MAFLNGTQEKTLFESHFYPLSLEQIFFTGQQHWCDDTLTLLEVCDGTLNMNVNGNARTLTTNQIALLGPYSFFSLESEGCTLLLLRLTTAELRQQFPENFEKPFAPFCSPNVIESLHRLFIKAARIAQQPKEPTPLCRQRFALTVLEKVSHAFGYETKAISDAKLERLADELRYCSVHYASPLSPKDAAARCYLSLPYFSKLFRQHVGLSYSEYVTELRLAAAVAALQQTDQPLQDIADECGFASPRAFSTAFRAKYGHLPSRVRSQKQTPEPPLAIKPFLFIHNQSTQAQLLRLQPAPIDCTAAGVPLDHSCVDCIPLGNAANLLHSSQQRALRSLVKSGGFTRGILHGILADELLCPVPEMPPNFTKLNYVLDFVLSLGITPVLRLDFGEPVNGIVAPRQNDENHLLNLTKALLQHLLQRYGQSKVSLWQLAPAPFAEQVPYGSCEQYFEFYRRLYTMVKSINTGFTLASPAFSKQTISEGNPWFAQFMGRCREYGCLPDDICIAFSPMEKNGELPPEALQNFLKRTLTLFQRMGLPYRKIFIEQYSLCNNTGDVLSDTMFHAVWLAKNLLENGGALASFAPAHFTDTPGAPCFRGDGGLLCDSGVPKSFSTALCLLNNLGQEIVSTGDGYILTRSGTGYQLLLYNYCHPDSLPVSMGEPFSRFSATTRRQFILTLSNLESNGWRRTDIVLSRSHGCAYEQWLKMGGNPLMTMEESDYLINIARPAMRHQTVFVENGSLTINQSLSPFTMHLVRLQASIQ